MYYKHILITSLTPVFHTGSLRVRHLKALFGPIRPDILRISGQSSAARWQHFLATTFLELFQLGQGPLGQNAKSNPYMTRTRMTTIHIF